ncbi:glycosyltransferase family 10 domain-containing protein [Helicobacter sp. 23-1048]
MFKKCLLNAHHKIYGKIYYPHYNLSTPIGQNDLNVYNEFGEKLEVFFIRDIHCAHAGTTRSRRILWDRYNFGLQTHFYTNNSMLETIGKPKRRYGMLLEAEIFVPNDYKIFDRHKGLEKDFDLIFTSSAKILDSISNARFVPFASEIWNEDSIAPDLYTKKSKNVSFLSSDKIMCELHKFRIDLALRCKRENLCDTFGRFDGGGYVKNISDTLNDYRFTICIENDVQPYLFTERLTSAFAAQTIPIYLGATEIDKFFNSEGIIKITTKSDIKEVLKQCTPQEYERRLPAVLDNYKRVMEQYTSKYDYLWENYFSKK